MMYKNPSVTTCEDGIDIDISGIFQEGMTPPEADMQVSLVGTSERTHVMTASTHSEQRHFN